MPDDRAPDADVEMRALRRGWTPLSVLRSLVIASLVLAVVIGAVYRYDDRTTLGWLAGILVLVATATGLQWLAHRAGSSANPGGTEPGVRIGLTLGLLWVVEISVNNLLAPPIPGRDIFDDVIWAAISVAIVLAAAITAYRGGRFRVGVEVGAWSGLASGQVACLTALSMVVVAMPAIVADPLNVTEWAARGGHTGAPGMAAYFALETFAGAFIHLIVLGPVFGLVLGVVGGAIGYAAARTAARIPGR